MGAECLSDNGVLAGTKMLVVRVPEAVPIAPRVARVARVVRTVMEALAVSEANSESCVLVTGL